MDILPVLAGRDVILRDSHFVYKEKGHGAHYINIDPVFPDMRLMEKVCFALGNPFWRDVDTVVGAATGGILLSVLTALSLGDGRRYPYPAAIWADKAGDDFAFDRSCFPDYLHKKRVLVVDDILNSGNTVKKVITQARLHSAEVVGVSVICNRGNQTAESLGIPRLSAIADVDFKVYNPEACPLCKANVPIVEDIGHGAEYKLQHPDYQGRYVKLLN